MGAVFGGMKIRGGDVVEGGGEGGGRGARGGGLGGGGG